MKDHDIPEVGSKYIDMYEDSDTLGDLYICLSEERDAWIGKTYQMRHITTGEVGTYQSFDWKKVDED